MNEILVWVDGVDGGSVADIVNNTKIMYSCKVHIQMDKLC